MSNDLFIGFGTNGPMIAQEVENSARRIEAVLGRTAGSIEIGRMSTASIDEWGRRLMSIIAQAQREIQSLGSSPNRGTETQAIYRRTMGRAAAATEEIRTALPEAMRYAQLGPIVQRIVERELSTAYGPGFRSLLPRVAEAAPAARQAGYVGPAEQYGGYGVASGWGAAYRNNPRTPEAAGLYAQDYRFMRAFVNDILAPGASGKGAAEVNAERSQAVGMLLNELTAAVARGEQTNVADVSRLLSQFADPVKQTEKAAGIRASEERYAALRDLQEAQREGRTLNLGGGMYAIDPGSENQRFVEMSRRGGATYVTDRLADAEERLRAKRERLLTQDQQAEFRTHISSRGVQLAGQDVWAVPAGPSGQAPGYYTAGGREVAPGKVRSAMEAQARATERLTAEQERQVREIELARYGDTRGGLRYMPYDGPTISGDTWWTKRGVEATPGQVRDAEERYNAEVTKRNRVLSEMNQASRLLQEAELGLAQRINKTTIIDQYGQPFGLTHKGTRAVPLTGFAAQDALASVRPGMGPGDPLSGGLLGNFFGGFFGKGFGGSHTPESLREGLLNLAGTAGSVAKYTVLYNALFAVQNVMRDTLQQAMDYSDSLRDLTVAMDEAGPPSQTFLNNLSEISRVAGENPGAALDAAARGIRAFTDAESSSGEIERAGTAVASASTQIALIASKDMKNATGDVIAIASAFGMAAEQAGSVVDAISTAKTVGGDPANISQGLANFATIANESGFTLQEAANAVAIVISKTDQSGQAAATRLARITSILGGTTGRSIIDRINAQAGAVGMTIDPNASIKEQLEQIAQAYQAAGQGGFTELQGLIRSALGGSSNTRELNALFDGSSSVFGATTDIGAGQREFDLKSQDLVGTLKKLQGDIINLQMALVQADIFAPFAVGIKVLEPALHLLTQFLNIYNQIWDMVPGGDVAQFVVTGAAEVLLAVNLIKRLSTVAGGLGASAAASWASSIVAGFRSAGAATGAAGATTAAQIRGAGSAVAASLASVAAQIRAGNISGALSPIVSGAERVKGGLGAALGSTAGKVGIAMAAALAGSEMLQDASSLNTLRAQVYDLARKSDPRDPALLAESLRSNAYQVGESGGFLSFLTSSGGQQANVDALAGVFDRVAEAAEAQRAVLSVESPFGSLATTSVEDLNSAVESLAASGASTTDVFYQLADAIAGMGEAGKVRLNGAEIGGAVAAGLLGEAGGVSTEGTSWWETLIKIGAEGTSAPDQLERRASSPEVIDSVNAFIQAEIAKNGNAPLDPLQLQILSVGAAEYYLAALGISPDDADYAPLRKRIYERVNTILKDQGAARQEGPISDEQVVMLANATATRYQAALGDARSARERAEIARARVQELRDLAAQGDDGAASIPVIVDGLATAERDIADAVISDSMAILDRRRNGMSATNFAQYAESELDRLLTQALGTGDVETVLSVMDKANLVQLRAMKGQLEAALEASGVTMSGRGLFSSTPEGQAAITAYETFMAAYARTSAGQTGGDFALNDDRRYEIVQARRAAEGAQDPVSVAARKVTEAQKAVDIAKKEDGKKSVAYWEAVGAYNEAVEAHADAVLEAAKAATGVRAARRGGSVASAAGEVRSAVLTLKSLGMDRATADDVKLAREAVEAAGEDAAARAQALIAYYNAVRAQREAMLQLASVNAKLGGDITDPVFMAAQASADARAKLASDVAAGQAPDVIAADRLALKEAQVAEERARFDQRLSDMQTAEELGRISHAAYIRYLDNEHDRLTAIKNRTRQQQDMLNQIDLALKAARDEMAGQWNLGDIKLPTPYEVRRSIAAQNAGQPYQSGSTVTINIDGADIGMVRRVLSEQLGTTVTTTMATSGRR